MATPFLIRGLLLRIRPQRHRFAAGLLFGKPHRPAYTTAATTEPTGSEENACPSSFEELGEVLTAKEPPQLRIFDSPDSQAWKEKEKEILQDIQPIIHLAKEILRSYKTGERLTPEHEQAVVDNLLSHHPNAEDKIGCGIDSITVDRHPLFRCSRCLFVVRTDGGQIDFSYRKCIRGYVRAKYPSHAEGFLSVHFGT